MLIRLNQIKIPITKDHPGYLGKKVADILNVPEGKIKRILLLKKSIDARNKEKMVYFVYNLAVGVDEEIPLPPGASFYEPAPLLKPKKVEGKIKPLVVGAGPCGLFAALLLAEAGVRGVLIDRGCGVEERVKRVNELWERGVLDEECNPQFGEGGAGTFSDGKLTTRVRDARIEWIFKKFVEFGAPKEILYEAKPHVGTDKLREVVKNIRKRLEDAGWEVCFRTRLEDIRVEKERLASILINGSWESFSDVVLAVGHSARDTYRMLHRRGVALKVKPFAVGFRIEHSQCFIDEAQYGRWAGFEGLPPATYQLAVNFGKRGVYTFCMCPGGYIICASSSQGRLVTNGMSYYRRDSGYANAAIVVAVDERDFGKDALSGVQFQEALEEKAFSVFGGFVAPCQHSAAFLGYKRLFVERCTYRPGVKEYPLEKLFPSHLVNFLKKGLKAFGRKIKGFDANGVLVAPETRTSAPVRILRGDDYQSVSARGLYPAGEGAGYAGGIVSSALDGLRVAEAIIEKYS